MAKDSSGTILLLGAAGLAVYGYSQGWFDKLFAASMLSGGPLNTGGPATKAPVLPAASPVPPLGTTVTNAADALRQVAANDAYILPDATTFMSFQGALPGGYNTVTTTDKGQILLRPDVYAAVSAILANRVKRAADAGAAAGSIQTAGQTTLQEIQTAMSTTGLSGLGDYQRHMVSRTGRIRPVRVIG